MEDIEFNGSNTRIDVYTVTRLYVDLKSIVSNADVNLVNILNVSLELMRVIEGYENLKGIQKKLLVLHLIEKYIDENVESDFDKKDLLQILHSTVPTAIDLMVGLDKNKIKINDKTIVKTVTSCFRLILKSCVKK